MQILVYRINIFYHQNLNLFMKNYPNLFFLILLYSHFAHAQDYKDWSVNFYTTNYTDEKISSQGLWRAERGGETSVLNVELVRSMVLTDKLILDVGLGFNALASSIKYYYPNADSLLDPHPLPPRPFAHHFYCPVHVKYKINVNKHWQIMPHLGTRISILPIGFYSNTYQLIEQRNSTEALYDAYVNTTSVPVIVSADGGVSLNFLFWKRHQLKALFNYSYSGQLAQSGDLSITVNGTREMTGYFEQKYNFWSLGLGYQFGF